VTAVKALFGIICPLVFVAKTFELAVALSEVNFPVLDDVDPIAPGDANVAPPNVAALIEVLHANPVPLVQISANDDVLQLGIEKAIGRADAPVPFASTVFAAIGARLLVASDSVAQLGAVVGPVDAIT
jgi:hypothetical protein